jgi:hypothetical protein
MQAPAKFNVGGPLLQTLENLQFSIPGPPLGPFSASTYLPITPDAGKKREREGEGEEGEGEEAKPRLVSQKRAPINIFQLKCYLCNNKGKYQEDWEWQFLASHIPRLKAKPKKSWPVSRC